MSWLRPVVKLYNGELTLEHALAAEDADNKKPDWQACEAKFFMGQWTLLHEAKQKAIRFFKLAASTCSQWQIERTAAIMELKTLGLEIQQ